MSLTLITLALFSAPAPQSLVQVAAPPPAAQFAAPVRLMAGDQSMGIKQLYPSPRLYDIDQDGQPEMVIGDLFGHVNVAEQTEDGAAAGWGPLEPFKTGDRPLKFHNW